MTSSPFLFASKAPQQVLWCSNSFARDSPERMTKVFHSPWYEVTTQHLIQMKRERGTLPNWSDNIGVRMRKGQCMRRIRRKWEKWLMGHNNADHCYTGAERRRSACAVQQMIWMPLDPHDALDFLLYKKSIQWIIKLQAHHSASIDRICTVPSNLPVLWYQWDWDTDD